MARREAKQRLQTLAELSMSALYLATASALLLNAIVIFPRDRLRLVRIEGAVVTIAIIEVAIVLQKRVEEIATTSLTTKIKMRRTNVR